MRLMEQLKNAGWFILKYLITNIVLISLLFIYTTRIEPYWIEVKKQPVYISNLPAAFEGFRIVQLSDLHGKLFSEKEVVTRANRLNPDIIVITGDVFDQNEGVPIEYADITLSGLNAKYGTYFVFGNNERYLNKQEVKERLARLNIKTLLNERVRLVLAGKSIDLLGVDDPYSMKADLSKTLKGVGPEPKILLAHTPEIIHPAAKAGIDLTLVGHTHGGQISIPFIHRFINNVSKGYEQYLSGLYEVENVQMYVNRGLGENDLHMRFLTRPEITLLTLHNKTVPTQAHRNLGNTN